MSKLIHLSKNLLITGFFIILCFIFTYPLIWDINSLLAGDGGDNYEFFGFQYVASESLSQGRNPLGWSDNFRYPGGIDLSLASDGKVAVVLGGLYGQLASPVLAYNLLVISLLFLSITTSYIFFYRYTSSVMLGLIGSVMYGASSYVLARSGSHLNLASVFGWPILALFLYEFDIKKPTKSVAKILFAVYLLTISSFQNFFFIFNSGIIFGVLYWLFYRDRSVRICVAIYTEIKNISIVFALFSLIVVVTHLSYLNAFTANQIELSQRSDAFEDYRVSLVSLMIPDPYYKVIGHQLSQNEHPSIEGVIFLGFLEVALLVLSLWYFRNNKSKYFLILIGLGIVLLMTGWGYRFFGELINFKGIPQTGRYFIVVYLLVTILVVDYLKNISVSRHLILWSILVILILSRIQFGYPISKGPDMDFGKIVASLPGRAVLNIPVSPFDSYYDLLPYAYEKNIVDGYIHWTGNNKQTLSYLNKFYPFSCNYDQTAVLPDLGDILVDQKIYIDQLFLGLVEDQAQTIVVHKDRTYHHPACEDVKTRTNLFLRDTVYIDTADNNSVKSSSIGVFESEYFYSELMADQEGIISFHGFLVAPELLSPIHIYINDDFFVEISENWTVDEHGARWVVNQNLSAFVNKGDKVRFFSPQEMGGSTWFTVWYSFEPREFGNTKEEKNVMIREMYSDDYKEIYQLSKF